AHRGSTPGPDRGDWRRVLADDPRLGPLHETTVDWRDRKSLDAAVDRFASVSFVAALAPLPRAALLDAIRERLQAVADADGTVALPYRTLTAWCAVAPR